MRSYKDIHARGATFLDVGSGGPEDFALITQSKVPLLKGSTPGHLLVKRSAGRDWAGWRGDPFHCCCFVADRSSSAGSNLKLLLFFVPGCCKCKSPRYPFPPPALGYQSIHAQTTAASELQLHTVTRSSVPEPCPNCIRLLEHPCNVLQLRSITRASVPQPP